MANTRILRYISYPFIRRTYHGLDHLDPTLPPRLILMPSHCKNQKGRFSIRYKFDGVVSGCLPYISPVESSLQGFFFAVFCALFPGMLLIRALKTAACPARGFQGVLCCEQQRQEQWSSQPSSGKMLRLLLCGVTVCLGGWQRLHFFSVEKSAVSHDGVFRVVEKGFKSCFDRKIRSMLPVEKLELFDGVSSCLLAGDGMRVVLSNVPPFPYQSSLNI